MNYLLDFDRTLFDTDAFKRALLVRPELAGFSPLEEMDLAAELNTRSREGRLAFAPGELAEFLYPDVRPFLEAYRDRVRIVTFGNPDLQRIKIESALAGLPAIEYWLTHEVRKGAYLANCELGGDPHALIDDAPLELEILDASCPHIEGIEIRRDGAPGDGRWPVIQSLADLP